MNALAAIQLDEFVITPDGAVSASIFTLENVLWTIFGCVALLMLVHVFVQLFSIVRKRVQGTKAELQGVSVIQMDEKITPFSFFQWIFINSTLHTSAEIAEILEHEQTHVRQWHSVDVIIGQIQKLLCWFNPAAWLLEREIRYNLEFLADNQVLKSGFEPKKYQYHLLSLTYESADSKLGNQFNVLPIKKRITMMNSKKTKKTGLLKYALIIPVALTMLVVSNVQDVIAATVEKTEISSSSEIEPSAGTELMTIGNSEVQQHVKSMTKTTPNAVITIEEVPAKNTAKGVEIATLKEHKDGENMNLDEMVIVGYSAQDKVTSVSDKKVYEVVETPPVFPGGEKAMYEYLAKNINYPVEAQKQKIEGRVTMQFIVSDAGKVISPRIIRGVDPLLDAEALRIINSMPNWTPGKQGGKNVHVRYTLPIQFKLTGGNSHGSSAKKLSDKTSDVKENANAQSQSTTLKKAHVVLDGKAISQEEMNEIDVNTIESISVLKDQSATELYGEKGKNGVIIITTKKK